MRPGGSVEQVARFLAPADGCTSAVVFDTHGVNPSLIASLPYDTKRDLAAVSLIGTGMPGRRAVDRTLHDEAHIDLEGKRRARPA